MGLHLGIGRSSFTDRGGRGRTMPVLGASLHHRTGRYGSGGGGVLLTFKGEGGSVSSSGEQPTYLEFPFLSLIEFSDPAGDVQVYAGGGFTPALLLRCRERQHYLDSFEVETTPCDLQPFDVGIDGRFGFRTRSGTGLVGLEFRYAAGILNVNRFREQRNKAFAVVLVFQRPLARGRPTTDPAGR
jgi:hypothetical protein